MNNGYVIVAGKLTDLDTSAYTGGTQLYLSPTTAGTYTSTKQYAPNHLVYVGIVVRAHPTQGSIEVKIQNGYELDELHDVIAQTPSNNDGIFYNSTSTKWENKSIATALGFTPLSGSGTTNTLPKFTGASALGNSNITDSGTLITLGSNTTISSGSLGIGSTSLTGYNLRIGKTLTGAITSSGIYQDSIIQSDVTNHALIFYSNVGTQATTFTLSTLSHFNAQQSTFGAGSTVSIQQGFVAGATLISGTTNYGFRGQIPAATGRFNLYMDGTANNYMAGSLGIGALPVAGFSLYVAKQMTGGVQAYGVQNSGTIQSDVTSQASYFESSSNTQATTFTLPNLRHFHATQGTIGAGSTITTQSGFQAGSSLIGATNNYGFRGSLASATGSWNLYMDGTANNYMVGSLGIGTTSLAGISLGVHKTITGSTTSFAVSVQAAVQSDVTGSSTSFLSSPSTQAAAFTLGFLRHFTAQQSTIGAGSSVTEQVGFLVASNVIGATTNIAFKGQIPVGTNRWNLYLDGSANNYIAGNLGIGTTSLTSINLNVSKTITGATTAIGINQSSSVQSDVTNNAYGIYNVATTQAASFTLTSYRHFTADQSTIGAGSSITTQVGFLAASALIGATNNYGFQGAIASGANRWNLYMNGTADNYMAGALGIGATFLTAHNLRVDRNITGGVVSHGIYNGGVVQSDVTTQARYYTSSASTQATTFTCSDLRHYLATQGTFGAGSTVSSQAAFFVDSTLIGAINNFGFRSQLASATGRWNLYLDGTASNHIQGTTLIGSTTDNGSGAKLQVTGSITYQNSFNRQTASYTLVLTDQNDIVEMNVASANNLTIPLNSSVAFPIGTEIQVLQYGAGQTTIVATSGVTTRSKSGQLKIANQYTGVTLVKVGTDEWYVIGNLTA